MSSKSFSLKSLFSYLEELDDKLKQQDELIKSLQKQLDSKASIQEIITHESEVKAELDQIKSDIKTIIGD
jgi:hypothetical protein